MSAHEQRPTNGFHWKMVDFTIRVIMPILTVLLSILTTTTLGFVLKNSEKLNDVEARLRVIEMKTVTMPPADYRQYIDTKFASLSVQLEHLQRALDAHMAAMNR